MVDWDLVVGGYDESEGDMPRPQDHATPEHRIGGHRQDSAGRWHKADNRPEHVKLIEYLKGVGYGWAKFAESVEASDKCTSKQLETMRSMKRRIQNHKRGRVTRNIGYAMDDDLRTFADNERHYMGSEW